jgi:hypothetical protein
MEEVYQTHLSYIEENTLGINIYVQPYNINFTLSSYPIPLEEGDLSQLSTAIKVGKFSNDIQSLFNHAIKTTYKDITVILYIQDLIVPYFKSEANIGDKVNLYGYLISHNQISNIVTILINAVNTQPK